MKLKHMWLALIPLCMASCSEEETIVSGESQREVRVTAGASNHSRVVLNDEGNHISSLWEAGDKISLFTATQSNLVYSTDAHAATAVFTPVDEALQDIERNTVYACYPEVSRAADEGMVVGLPSTTTMDYDNGSIRSFGYATSTISGGSVNFQFKHISAFIALEVKPEMLTDATKGISRITVSTSSSQPLSVGEGDTFDFSSLTASTGNGTNTVQINVDNYVVDSLWTVYIPILPQPAGADITITLTDSEGQTLYTQTKQTPSSGFLAGRAYHQKAVEVEKSAYLTYGRDFNDRVKQLANDMVNGAGDRNRLITQIKFKTEDETTPPASHVTVYADYSSAPIYATYNPVDSLLTVFTPAKSMEIEDAANMFEDMNALRTIDFGNFSVTAKTMKMNQMFYGCNSLVTFDASNWNTENVVEMHKMFEGCHSLTTLDVSHWNVGKVELMYQTFALCNSLTTMDVSNWNTESVVDMCWMFDSCTSLTTLDVSNWNVEKVGNMEGMFYNCSALTTLDVSNWNTSNVVTMAMMFEKCSSLTTLDVSRWDVGKLEATRQMFDGCSSLTALDVSNWNTQSLKGLQAMFINCSSLEALEVGNWNVANVESFGGESGWGGAFEGCSSLITLDVSNWDTQKVKYMGNMFKGCTALTTLDVSNWNTENVEGMQEMFFRCHSLTNLDVSNWKVDKVTNMATMFEECYVLEALDVADWNTANVENMTSMFSGCKTLTSLAVDNWDVSNVTDMHFMFANCSALTSLNLGSWDVTKAGDMGGVFKGCSALQTLDVSGWNTTNFSTVHEMFMDCFNLSKLDISNWQLNYDTGNYMLFYDMFHDCASTSKACKVTANQEIKKFLLDTAISTGMNPDWFIWGDEEADTFSIVGTWEMVEGDMDEWTIIFREDGTGLDSWVDEGEQDEYEFTYSLDWENRKLYTQVSGEEPMEWEIVAYSDTEVTLRYSFDGGSAEYKFKKV